MLKYLKAGLIFCICSPVFGGILVQPQGPIVPGTTAVFDLIVKNETTSNTWQDNFGRGFTVISPFAFMEPGSGVTLADVISMGGLGGIVPVANPSEGDMDSWDINSLLGDFTIVSLENDGGVDIILAPGEMFQFGTLHLDIDSSFAAGDTFDLQFIETPDLLSPLGESVTASPPAEPPVTNPWAGDANPPVGKDDDLGSHGPAVFTFTAVPEPSPVLLLGLLSCLIGGRRYLPKFK